MMRRDEAHQLVDDAFLAEGDACRLLAAHWDIPGHWNENTTRDDWYFTLHDHVNETADALLADGGYASDADPCDLTAPEGAK